MANKTNPKKPITFPFTSNMLVSIKETKTGNQVFSGSVRATATVSAQDVPYFPDALGIAARLATGSAIIQCQKLLREHIKNSKLEQNSKAKKLKSKKLKSKKLRITHINLY